MNTKTIAVTMGDPAGIGPEIIIKTLLVPELSDARIVIMGSKAVLERQMREGIIPHLELRCINHVNEADFTGGILNIFDVTIEDIDSLTPGQVQAQAGDLAYRCIKLATELAIEGQIQGIATAPLNKEALHLANHLYPGHTELLAHLTGTKDYAMVLFTEKLKVIHVSTHIALRKFLDTLNQRRVVQVINIANSFLKRIGIKSPRIAVAGVNPHAGENGLFGDEEINILQPAINEASSLGVSVSGAHPPDTVFLQAYQDKYDIVVAMYHDQGHIPLKLLGFYDGVNITAGLPFIRTSADHGTAFDIAWQGIANPQSMKQAIELALQLA